MAELRAQGPAFRPSTRVHDPHGRAHGRVIGAKWAEIISSAKLWTIPPERMKAGKEHRVPLSDRAIDNAQGASARWRYVFVGRREGSLCRIWRCWNSYAACAEGLGLSTASARRSAIGRRSRPSYPHEMCEIAPAHTVEQQSRGRLPARRHDGEAPASHGRLGRNIVSRRRRSRRVPRSFRFGKWQA